MVHGSIPSLPPAGGPAPFAHDDLARVRSIAVTCRTGTPWREIDAFAPPEQTWLQPA